jgi:hypothetical protein
MAANVATSQAKVSVIPAQAGIQGNKRRGLNAGYRLSPV